MQPMCRRCSIHATTESPQQAHLALELCASIHLSMHPSIHPINQLILFVLLFYLTFFRSCPLSMVCKNGASNSLHISFVKIIYFGCRACCRAELERLRTHATIHRRSLHKQQSAMTIPFHFHTTDLVAHRDLSPRSTTQSISQQSINQSINQSTNKSIKQPLNRNNQPTNQSK
jgi:hypothetical protein